MYFELSGDGCEGSLLRKTCFVLQPSAQADFFSCVLTHY